MIIYLLTFLWSSFAPTAHDFKMSVCEINYVQEREAFEVRFYIFQDDLKETLYGDPLAAQLEEAAVRTYILEHVEIQLNGRQMALDYSGIKERSDQVQVIFFSKTYKLEELRNVLVINDLLLDKFKKQTNMVYLSIPGHNRLTKILNLASNEGRFDL